MNEGLNYRVALKVRMSQVYFVHERSNLTQSIMRTEIVSLKEYASLTISELCGGCRKKVLQIRSEIISKTLCNQDEFVNWSRNIWKLLVDSNVLKSIVSFVVVV